ncbi:MAG: choice-of-anchor J domain-containing protein, partial [Bacteroidaceae bacterium]|nr:choice-of-anchor J domain-containing protein [Bacteroidaceae bacterium]
MKRKRLLTKALLTLFAVLFSLTGAKAQKAAPAGIAAANITANSADISWTGDADSYNLRYRSITEGAVTFSDNFEEGISQWSIVRNGEGNENTDWRQFDGSFSEKVPAHSGNYMVMSRSWSGNAYNVDNWMISPLVDLGGILKFWVRDDGNYHEHYDIYVSTSTNAISSFTKVYEPGNA